MTAGGAARVAPQGGGPCAARGRGREPQSQPRHMEIGSSRLDPRDGSPCCDMPWTTSAAKDLWV